MSLWVQVLAIFVFLAYSVAYLLFVAWAADRAQDGASSRPPGLVVRVLGLAVPLGGLLLLTSLLRT